MQLAYVQGTTKAFDALLVDHQIHLRNVIGVGYRYVPATEQSSAGYHDGLDVVKKGFRHITKVLANVNLQALNDEKRAEHADYCAKLSKAKGMMRSLRRSRPDGQLQIRSA